MTYTTDDITKRSLETFRRFDVDTQLALLWFGYKDLKDQLTPAGGAEGESIDASATALFDQIQALPQEQQLQAQRDLLTGADSGFSQTYKSLHSSPRLNVWLKLAQGMEEGTIIQVPSDYELPAETNEFVDMVSNLDFEQRLDFMRSAVVDLGS